MFQRMIRQIAVCSLATLVTSSASAQFFPGSSIDPCAPAQPVSFAQVTALPQQCVTTCQPAPLVPVAQTCYQTVPTVEYQEVKRTVERPVVETRYVDQEVTAYRPITETRVTEVPTVNYQNVTEYQTVTRDMGQWVTQRECIQRPSPCQYDGRPGLLGGMNRFGYSLRSAFSPSFRTHRQYIPNYVAQTVPVTRQVAIQGTRQVTYNVTKMEPYKTTRKVAVNSVRMVAEQVTEMQPVTVMKTVPTGTRVTYVSPSSLGTATALAPSGSKSASVASGPLTPVPSRTANASDSQHYERKSRPTSSNAYEKKPSAQKPFEADGDVFKSGQIQHDQEIQHTSHAMPVTQYGDVFEAPETQPIPTSATETAKPEPTSMPRPLTPQPPVRPSRTIPSIVRVNQWSGRVPAGTGAPKLMTPGISVAVD